MAMHRNRHPRLYPIQPLNQLLTSAHLLLPQLQGVSSRLQLGARLLLARRSTRFYQQVVTNESPEGERLRQTIRQKPSNDKALSPDAVFVEKLKDAGDLALLQYLADGKSRKPN